MKIVVRVLVWLLAAANLAWGAAALLFSSWAAGVLALTPQEAHASGEIRAVFGGLVFVMGALMVAALVRPERVAWLTALAYLFVGLVVGRVISLALDGPGTYTLVAICGEGLGALLLFLEARNRRAELRAADGS